MHNGELSHETWVCEVVELVCDLMDEQKIVINGPARDEHTPVGGDHVVEGGAR